MVSIRWLELVESTIRHATGWPGFGIIFIYSFLVAFILPVPSELVLFAPLNLGIGNAERIMLIIAVSSAGKALGSLVAFQTGVSIKQSGAVKHWMKRSGLNIIEWSEKRTIELARKHGYLGLTLGLSVPFFPDTASIYAFTVLDDNPRKFAAATFTGSVIRLVIVAVFLEGMIQF